MHFPHWPVDNLWSALVAVPWEHPPPWPCVETSLFVMWHCGATGIGGWKLEMPLHFQKCRSAPTRMTLSQRQLLKCCQCIKSGCVRLTEQTPDCFCSHPDSLFLWSECLYRSFVFNVITCPVGCRSAILLLFCFFNCLGLPRATPSLDDSQDLVAILMAVGRLQ